jgi:hypothetical protein
VARGVVTGTILGVKDKVEEVVRRTYEEKEGAEKRRRRELS